MNECLAPALTLGLTLFRAGDLRSSSSTALYSIHSFINPLNHLCIIVAVVSINIQQLESGRGGFGPSLSDFKALAPKHAAKAGPPQGWGNKVKTWFLTLGRKLEESLAPGCPCL